MFFRNDGELSIFSFGQSDGNSWLGSHCKVLLVICSVGQLFAAHWLRMQRPLQRVKMGLSPRVRGILRVGQES